MYSWTITPQIVSDLERLEDLRRSLDGGRPRRRREGGGHWRGADIVAT
ncbi:MAG: hypothetical protein U1F44_04180 [Coriobacteriia bacterium]|nr:hypothetical protein [Coriobacteriia bacterium]